MGTIPVVCASLDIEVVGQIVLAGGAAEISTVVGALEISTQTSLFIDGLDRRDAAIVATSIDLIISGNIFVTLLQEGQDSEVMEIFEVG